jgi:hypothetical protein
MNTLRIGCGAGYAGDRIEPAVELAREGGLDYLVFECLAERTIAMAQLAHLRDNAAGYDVMLGDRLRAVLPAAVERGTGVITNMGAANPQAATDEVIRIARDLGLARRVATVTGDNVMSYVKAHPTLATDDGRTVGELSERLVSANAYIGAAAIVEALSGGAHVVITGRVADPALFLAPLIHRFGWSEDDWSLLGAGTLAGHLLECAGQVTGGYFADTRRKHVEDLARLGFPLAEVREDGHVVITKVAGSGGRVTAATCKEQLLYEIQDPADYRTPDVVADFSRVSVEEIGSDRVAVRGASGHPRPDQLKVSLGYMDGFIGEGQISYAGPGAVARGRLAIDIVRERLTLAGVPTHELQADLIGVDSLFGRADVHRPEPFEVRVRVAARTATLADARRVGNEVETLYTNGPAGGGGATKSAREVLAIASTFVPRHAVTTAVTFEDVA